MHRKENKFQRRGASIAAGPARPGGSSPALNYIANTCGRATYKLTREEIVRCIG